MRPPVIHRTAHYDRRLLPNEHLRALEEASTGRSDWEARTGASVGYPAWGLLYYLTMCRLKPGAFNLVIETGTNLGSSAIVLAQAIKDSPGTGVLRTVEIEPANHAKAAENFRAAKVDDVIEQHLGDALEQLPAMLEGPHPVSVAFLDGSHLFDQVIAEFELVLPRLAPDSIVIFDNTYQIAEPHEDQRVHGALQAITEKFGGNLVNLPFCSWFTPGMAVWQQTPFADGHARVAPNSD